MHGVLHVLGVDDLSGRWYGFWSGFGSDLGYLGIIAALVRKHNCQVRRCWRFGRHEFTEPDSGAVRLLCWRHHPSVDRSQLTKERLHLYLGERPGRG